MIYDKDVTEVEKGKKIGITKKLSADMQFTVSLWATTESYFLTEIKGIEIYFPEDVVAEYVEKIASIRFEEEYEKFRETILKAEGLISKIAGAFKVFGITPGDVVLPEYIPYTLLKEFVEKVDLPIVSDIIELSESLEEYAMENVSINKAYIKRVGQLLEKYLAVFTGRYGPREVLRFSMDTIKYKGLNIHVIVDRETGEVCEIYTTYRFSTPKELKSLLGSLKKGEFSKFARNSLRKYRVKTGSRRIIDEFLRKVLVVENVARETL